MQKRIIYSVLVGLLIQQNAYSQEKLSYTIYYGVVSLGKAEISTENIMVKNRQVVHAVARFATIGDARRLFEIDDIYESYFDAKTYLPLKFTSDIKEEKYRYNNEVLFYHKSLNAKTKNYGNVAISKGTRDIVSAFLYARKFKMNSLKLNDVVDISGFLKNNTVVTKLKYVADKTIKIEGKTYQCRQFAPMVYSEKLVNPEKDVAIYITADASCIPIRIEVKLPTGSFKADIKNK